MALGAYGIKRPADVLPDDVQIIVHYTPNRDATANFVVSQLPANTLLTPHYHQNNTGGANGVEILGVYMIYNYHLMFLRLKVFTQFI